MNEIGRLSLLVAFFVSFYALVSSIFSAKTKREDFKKSSENAILSTCVLIIISSVALLSAFITRDFSLRYVAEYSSKALPLSYTISAFYGGQAGSLLFWVLFLVIFSTVVVFQNKKKHRDLIPYVNAINMAVSFFFLFVINFLSNPFEKLPFTPEDGRGLNPLLQNPGMFFHPPTLYLGYVGFTIPFAFAIASLITKRLDELWIRTTRRWTIFAWLFLGLGNLFGSWWAYVELGWGGFWMWDPVENASFMPWLTATAYLHSVMIQEKKRMLKVWNFSLIIITFALSIFGTFLTRSGVIQSVHSFAQTSIGYYFLGFLIFILIFSFGLLFLRWDELKSKNEIDSLLSRESSFLFNNLLLVGATFAVFWGTIFPLISEAVRGVKITVGPPFFNYVTVPIFLLLLILTGICPLIAWRKASLSNLSRNFLYPCVFSLLCGIVLYVFGIKHIPALFSFVFSIFVFATIILEFYRGTKARSKMTKENYIKAFFNLIWRNKRRYGGYIVHIGVILIFVGATGKAFKYEKIATLKKGEKMKVKNYTLRYDNYSTYSTQQKEVFITTMTVFKNNKKIGVVRPEKDYYKNQDQPTTEVAVFTTLKEDLFIILAEINENNAVTFKTIINPLIVWLWLGGFVIFFGGLLVLLPDKREDMRIAKYLREEVRIEI
jgi:cytochrome c-type biogenesis protein CcmF